MESWLRSHKLGYMVFLVLRFAVCNNMSIGLSVVFSYDCVEYSKLEYYTSPYELFDILDRDRGERFDLNPLSELLYLNQEEFGLPLAWAKVTANVHPPDGERSHTRSCGLSWV